MRKRGNLAYELSSIIYHVMYLSIWVGLRALVLHDDRFSDVRRSLDLPLVRAAESVRRTDPRNRYSRRRTRHRRIRRMSLSLSRRPRVSLGRAFPGSGRMPAQRSHRPLLSASTSGSGFSSATSASFLRPNSPNSAMKASLFPASKSDKTNATCRLDSVCRILPHCIKSYRALCAPSPQGRWRGWWEPPTSRPLGGGRAAVGISLLRFPALRLEALIGGRHGGGLLLDNGEDGAELARCVGKPRGAFWEG